MKVAVVKLSQDRSFFFKMSKMSKCVWASVCVWSLQGLNHYFVCALTSDHSYRWYYTITLAALGILPYLLPDVRCKADMSKIVYLIGYDILWMMWYTMDHVKSAWWHFYCEGGEECVTSLSPHGKSRISCAHLSFMHFKRTLKKKLLSWLNLITATFTLRSKENHFPQLHLSFNVSIT